ncbi:DUF58 domain-containing protein [Jiangella asiatica]|uniref:DUF58 domain-containing protein n=1 Tax=Jiangella asiatica TaxID=2530372 RepID=A0A4R5DAN0_9ACTN|nr:DUF58 domain-containing protein [Jiangella asiatica]TDE09897.1 DUF58 domain-containing protein [Jiangella asiatica]
MIERRLGLTAAGVAVVVLGAAGWAIGRLLESRGVFLLVYGGIVALVVSWLLGQRRPALSASRSTPPPRVRPGRRVEVEVELTARRRVSTVVVEDELDERLGQSSRFPVAVLPGGRSVRHTYGFVPQARGVFRVGPLVAEWSDPFGLTRRRVTLVEPQEVIVHPRVERVTDRITTREWEDPPVRPPVLKPWPTGFEFYGLRDYVPGDDPRRIVWRAVGRYDRYLVRESEQGITDRVNILLDTDARRHSPGTPSETFELAVSVAASLAVHHLDNGFGLNLDLNSERLAGPLRGRTQHVRLLDQLAVVDTERAPLSQALERLLIDPMRHAHNVVVTPEIDPVAARRIRLLRSQGVAVLLVLTVWDDTEPATLHRAGLLGCNLVQVSAGSSMRQVFEHVVGVTGVRR